MRTTHQKKQVKDISNNLTADSNEQPQYTWQYKGETLNGLKHGQGTLNRDGKLFYEGSFKSDLRHGYGKRYTPSETYIGYWSQNLKHGMGQTALPNGDMHKGHYFQDKRNGFGIERKGNMFFTGFWDENLKQGEFMGFNLEKSHALQIIYENDLIISIEKITPKTDLEPMPELIPVFDFRTIQKTVIEGLDQIQRLIDDSDFQLVEKKSTLQPPKESLYEGINLVSFSVLLSLKKSQ